MNTPSVAAKHLSKLPFWVHLSPEERGALEEQALYLSYPQGYQVRSATQQCLGVLLVVKGVLRTYLLSPDGREVNLYRTRAGETYLLTASCVLESISFQTQVDAEVDTEVLLIPSPVFSTLVVGNLQVECDSYKLLVGGFSEVVSSIERLVFLSLEQRLASFLLDEAQNSPADTIHLTHEQIAVSIGSARVAVSRALNKMAGQGLVALSRGKITLLDVDALRRILDSPLRAM